LEEEIDMSVDKLMKGKIRGKVESRYQTLEHMLNSNLDIREPKICDL
jgi:hypothetical protein